MNFVQPSIDPVILSYGIFELRWYSLAYIIGFIIGSILLKRFNKNYGSLLSNKEIDNFLIWAVIGVIFGGRIGYVLFYQSNLFINDPTYIFKIWNGGMSFHGGLIGIILSIYIYSKKNNLTFFYLSDLVSLCAPIGLFFGRLANFINTELIGRPTDFIITIIYPSIDNQPRHPSQIYEAIFEGLILFIILLLLFNKNKNKKNYGLISGMFLIYYSIFRFCIEFLREPDHHIGFIFYYFSLGQILSIPIFIFGIIIINYNGFIKKN